MTHGADGTVLLAPLGLGAVAYRHGRFETITAEGALASSFVLAMAQLPGGDIWLGTRDAGLVRVRGGSVTPVTAGLPDQKVNCLLAGPADQLLIGTDRGVARWTGAVITTAGVPAALASIPVLGMIRDRASNVWIAAGPRGLLRLSGERVSGLDGPAVRPVPMVAAVFEDREGNIWYGNSRGIGRLRETVFTAYTAAQGLPSDAIGPVYADADGRTWFAGADGALFQLDGARVDRIVEGGLGDDVVYSIAGRGDEVWVGRQQGGLTHIRLHGGTRRVTRFTQADGLAQNNVFAVQLARDGGVWAGTLSGGVSRYKDGSFTTYTVEDGLASNTVAAIAEAADGTLWFGTPNGVSTWAAGTWRRLRRENGLPSNEVNTLFEDAAGGMWVGTSAGLAYIRGGTVQPMARPPSLGGPILGLVEDRTGWLWVATSDGLLRVHRQRLVSGKLGPGDLREFGAADGLIGLDGVKRFRSVALDARGRVWFATSRGLASANPVRAAEPAATPLVHIAEVAADGAPIGTAGVIEVPPGTQRVAIGFAGLNLSVPERVVFRYRLDGFDRDWTAPGAERHAVYTNLAPGPYVFRAIASSGDGVWNATEARVSFDVRPQPWQTAWFRVVVLMLCGLAGWGLYRLRVRQVARQLSLRFDERLAERTRIAQELHDTLLQGFVSASMQLHVATDRLPDDSPAKTSLTRVLDLMGRVIEEGRNAVRGLRSTSGAPGDLEEAFAGIQQELDATADTEYRLIVEGRPRLLAPMIRDEVYRIGREALANAFRHSGGRNVELELDYAASGVTLLVRDNGRGIDERVVASGSDGHWGLPGMRERAERIGAHLSVSTHAAAGTEVSLHVPGTIAYFNEPGQRRWRWRLPKRRRVVADRDENREARP
jgi:signal transduction histidine kinase